MHFLLTVNTHRLNPNGGGLSERRKPCQLMSLIFITMQTWYLANALIHGNPLSMASTVVIRIMCERERERERELICL